MRKYLLPLAAVAVVVNLLGVGLSSAAQSSYPRIFGKSGFNDGPVHVQQTLSPVGTISVPKGNWLISAKLYLENVSSPRTPVRVLCQLSAGGDFDESATTLGNLDQILNSDSLAMQVVHTFDDASNEVSVNCGATGANKADAYMIKISAMKVGRLSNVGLH